LKNQNKRAWNEGNNAKRKQHRAHPVEKTTTRTTIHEAEAEALIQVHNSPEGVGVTPVVACSDSDLI